ncbi:MAG: phosphodiester glycosidase family protein [Pedobacter sp.]|nr:MAG: phosphodiester glycosidase family protein [Pedobacter sp.]
MKSKVLNILAFLLLTFGSVKGQKAQQHFAADSSQNVWKKSTLKKWLTLYQFDGYYEPFKAGQIVNVLDIDLNDPESHIAFVATLKADSLSATARTIPNAIAAVNGTYYEILRNKNNPQESVSSSFFKSAGNINTEVSVPEGHLLYWKHEGAFYYDPAKQNSGIVYGNNKEYKALPYANVVSGSPMLIYNYKPVGETFAKKREKPLDSLNYEDPDRHQGVRHPRTAVARTVDNHVLLITVDGRAQKAAGMSAKELTQFIRKWFNPKDALNLDGGGSTTMWIKDSNVSSTGVINYPTDDKKFDHNGQRKIRNSLIITTKN